MSEASKYFFFFSYSIILHFQEHAVSEVAITWSDFNDLTRIFK